MRKDYALCYSHALMLTSSPSTFECLFHSIPGLEKAFFVMYSYRTSVYSMHPTVIYPHHGSECTSYSRCQQVA